MDALVILGMVIWAAVVVMLVSILLATGKWEDQKRRFKVQKPAFQANARGSADSDTCYDSCMKDFLWNPRKKTVCMATCGL